MADLNKLAILTNELGGIDEVAELLETDEDLLQFAIEGGGVTFAQDAEINRALNNFILDKDSQDEYQIDIEKLFGINDNGYSTGAGYDNALEDVSSAINDQDDINLFRWAVADGRVELDELATSSLLFKQGHSTPNVIDKIVSWLVEDAHNAKEFLDLFELDGFNIQDVQDSFFWEWFRETFY